MSASWSSTAGEKRRRTLDPQHVGHTLTEVAERRWEAFVAEPGLGCVQAPLRIRRHPRRERAPMFDRQFALEYASLFEVTLPGMARLGLPFPKLA